MKITKMLGCVVALCVALGCGVTSASATCADAGTTYSFTTSSAGGVATVGLGGISNCYLILKQIDARVVGTATSAPFIGQLVVKQTSCPGTGFPNLYPAWLSLSGNPGDHDEVTNPVFINSTLGGTLCIEFLQSSAQVNESITGYYVHSSFPGQ